MSHLETSLLCGKLPIHSGGKAAMFGLKAQLADLAASMPSQRKVCDLHLRVCLLDLTTIRGHTTFMNVICVVNRHENHRRCQLLRPQEIIFCWSCFGHGSSSGGFVFFFQTKRLTAGSISRGSRFGRFGVEIRRT